MHSSAGAQARRYQGIVFKMAPATADFSSSTEISLPGTHTEQHAWQLVFAELRGPRGPEYIGGDVRPC